MKDSSDRNPDAFQGIELRNVYRLLSVIGACERPLRQTVRARYCEEAVRFAETETFLDTIGLIAGNGSELLCSIGVAAAVNKGSEQTIASLLLTYVMSRQSVYRQELCEYLASFRLDKGEIRYCPPARDRGRKSHVRNFLMDCGALDYSEEHNRYQLTPDYIHLYASIRLPFQAVSPGVLTERLQSQQTLGMRAEEAMVSYEKKRLGPTREHMVDHVALRNVAAGYDIRSLTVENDGTVHPRYIEVKAVSRATPSFYWTVCEMAMAELLRARYYLYLLPVVGQDIFEVRCLRIIRDPHDVMLVRETEWCIREQVVRCSLKEGSWDQI